MTVTLKPVGLSRKEKLESGNRVRGFWNRYCGRGYRFICLLLCFKETFKTWLQILIPQSGERVLDGGTGTGGMFRPIIEKVQPRKIVAVDFSDKMLEDAQKTARRLLTRDKSLIYRIIHLFRRAIGHPTNSLNDLGFQFESVDLTEPFPWPDSYFGAETFSLVICYMLEQERERVLREAYRTLKPAGYVYVSTCLEGWDFSKEVRKRMPKEFLLGPINSLRALPVVPCTKEMDGLRKEGIFVYPKEGELAVLLEEIGFTDICTVKSFGGGIEIVRAQKPLSYS